MRLNRMFIRHCPKIAELYITPRNLGFYECNGVEAVALGARVVQDTGQAGGRAFDILPDGQKVDVLFKSVTATSSATSKTRYTIWE